jgi:pyruvate-ferredoxin/flavodoxin oxidoreductase
VEVAALQQRYNESVAQRESSLDVIARAMSELAAASSAPAGSLAAAMSPFGAGASTVSAASTAPSPAAASSVATPSSSATGTATLPFIHDEDVAKCTNCKTCYQEVSELFEKTKLVVNGVTKDVAHMIPGALATVNITPELIARVARVAANCDAEIIR